MNDGADPAASVPEEGDYHRAGEPPQDPRRIPGDPSVAAGRADARMRTLPQRPPGGALSALLLPALGGLLWRGLVVPDCFHLKDGLPHREHRWFMEEVAR